MAAGLNPGPVTDDRAVTALLKERAWHRKMRAATLYLLSFSHIVPSPLRKLLKPIKPRILQQEIDGDGQS